MSTSPSLGARAQLTKQLMDFRNDFYDCLGSWADALFELTDAALCAPGPVSSVPALSLGPNFRRSHGSLYKALSRGEVDADGVRELLVRYRPADWPLVFALDASTWERCDAETSPERGFYHSASKHSAGQPIVAGWSFQWVSQLNFEPDSWTAPLDAMRIPPTEDATDATVAQVQRLTEMLPADGPVPMFVLDAGYDPAGLSYGLAGTRPRCSSGYEATASFSPSLPKMPARRAAQGATAGVSSSLITRPLLPPTPRCAWKTAATARSASVPGTTCTRACMPGDAGPGAASRPSCVGASSGSTSNASRSRAPGPTTSCCGSGGPAQASPTSSCASTPTSTASTWSTPTAS